MADNIQATPRNYLGGLLTDAYKWMQSPERTQQMQGFAGLLGTTGLPQTIERMAYGEPLTNIGRANVPLLKPETADALMTVAPMVGPAARGAKMLPKNLPVGMSIKPVGAIDELTGLPLNADGTVTLFHHTNKSAAEQIAKTGRLKSTGEPSVYLTTQKATDTGYGDVAVPVRVKPSLLNLDDEFPSGRMDFSIDTGKPKGSIPVTVEKPSFTYPQEEAMRLAQQRAALPVEQGGLGLSPSNTADERAAAMGFDTDLLHGTDQSLKKFEAKRSISKDHGWYGDEGVYLTPDPNTASGYANWKNVGAGVNGKLGQELYGQNVMPLVINRGNVFDYGDAPPLMDREKSKEFSETIKRLGFNSIEVPNKYASPEYKSNYETVILNPDDIRSRFAAFDPFRRTAATAAAMGVAAPDLLAQEQPVITQQQIDDELAMYGLLGR